jgi:hypothetical protein
MDSLKRGKRSSPDNKAYESHHEEWELNYNHKFYYNWDPGDQLYLRLA